VLLKKPFIQLKGFFVSSHRFTG